MRVMLLHKLAEHIPEDYVPPQKPIAGVGKMVSDARDAGLLRMIGGAAPNFPTASKLPLLGSNQDSPDLESSRPGRHFGQPVGNRPLSEHRCPLPGRSLPAPARRNYGKTAATRGKQ
jgi:hypothetical protein